MCICEQLVLSGVDASCCCEEEEEEEEEDLA